MEYPYIFNAVFFNYTRNHGVDGHWAHMHLGVVLETYIGYGTPRLDIDSALQSSQPLIKQLKKDIPQYHT